MESGRSAHAPIALAVAVALFCWPIYPVAAAWSYRWRSLNEPSAGGGLCPGAMQTSNLAAHFNEALVDIFLFQALKEISADVPETCGLIQGALDDVSRNLGTSALCLNPHGTTELLAIRQYLQLLQRSTQLPAIVAATLAAGNYQDLSGGALQRGFFDSLSSPTLTSGPSESELIYAAYHYILGRNWSYVGLVWEAELGAARLSQLLQASAASERRLCLPLLVSYQVSNVTNAARALKEFVYTAKKLSRFTVVHIGSGSAFLQLWNLVSGGESSYADTEKRLQFVLVGEAFSSYHQISDSTRRKNLALGTVFIFPGILDPNPSSDELRLLFNNITSDAGSMGPFKELVATHARLKSLKDATNSLCTWSDVNSFCYHLALRYEFIALSLASLLVEGAPTLSSMADVQRLRQKEVSLTVLRATLTGLDAFTREGYTTYSLDKGLQHATRGYWQPITKIYQSQLVSGSSYALVKLGELTVKQAGTTSQTYEFNVNSNSSHFYELKDGNPDFFPILASNSASECPSSCPECLRSTAKQFIQFKEGDIYLGALVPVFYKGSDVFDCSDGTFRGKSVGGHEFGMAFKFIVDLVDSLSQGSPTLPPGFDASKVDPQFLLGVKELLQRVHDRRARKLRWGYIVLDTCYSPSCTVRRLGSLLDGRMTAVPGFNYTQVVGFVGALSSTQTMAASQLLKMYNLPLITYGSTSTALSDVSQYPYVLRTVSSDTVIIEAMVLMLKHLKVDYVSVVYAPTAYGMSLRDEMKSIATREGICISNLIAYDCGEDDSCRRNKMFALKDAKTRYVSFLATLPDLISLLSYAQAETDIGYLTFLTTESVGVSDAAFVGKKNIGLGTLSMKLVSSPAPAFSAFVNYTLTRVPTENVNNIPDWDRLYLEDAQQCYLGGSYVRNSRFTQQCLQSLVETHPVTDVESRSPFVIDAASTLVLGSLTAMTYLCVGTTLEPACPSFFAGDYNSMQQRAQLVMYGSVSATDPRPQSFRGSFGGSAWAYRKVFDNRMGQTPFSLWQYRKQGSVDFQFVQIGNFDGTNSSTFSETPEHLMSMERNAGRSGDSDPATAGCRTLAECKLDRAKCANGEPATPTTAKPTVVQSDSQLGFLGLLFLPGFLLGFLPVCCINLVRNRCLTTSSEGENATGGEANSSLPMTTTPQQSRTSTETPPADVGHRNGRTERNSLSPPEQFSTVVNSDLHLNGHAMV